ncbi:fumarylacetoacetate hydrolase family protein [Pararhizobium sp. IMCC21322]|uniref:fumarylacetoacetate hydrolase family protein n=1 Tax=Pararhizobium sp. IMCC21322 TaxID=3067903 RepID=UPI0027413534|nr:fumarylacetoacetate hydrolase family protein [Pararhizobium sp. IMCC21322]
MCEPSALAVCVMQNYSMKLVSFSQFDRTGFDRRGFDRSGNGVAPASGSAPEHLGWVQEDLTTVLIVNPTLTGMPASMMEVIAGGDAAVQKIASAADQLQSVSLDAINLLPPLTDPKGIFCVGLNYADHEREAPVAGTDYPTIFLRLARNQIAHGQAMVAPGCSPTLDWEGELAAIIGKPGRADQL